MNIEIKYCNNIENANVSIEQNKLNIKYAINGTGKSTIVKGIRYRIEDQDRLKELKPFKYYSDSTINPEVVGTETFDSIMIFDEYYINQFVYQKDELLKGSFNILIRNENYDRGITEIEALIYDLRKVFSDSEELNILISNFTALIESFGKEVRSGISGASPISKAFREGNLVKNIPESVINYKNLIQSDISIPWVKWQLEGQNYLEISECCPYCTSGIEEKKHIIKAIKEVYDPKTIEHLNKVLKVFTDLKVYFIPETQLQIDRFINNINGYTDDEVHFLLEIKSQIERLRNRLLQIKALGFQSLKDVDRVVEQIEELIIDLNLYGHLNSEYTINKIYEINNQLEVIKSKAGIIQGKVFIQKKLIHDTVEAHKTEINGFLSNAGYKYSVVIEDDSAGGEMKLKLRHNEFDDTISQVNNVLSYGERNAFALVLFMFDALKSNPSLIVLDDPISSFDHNKKFAIIEMLFKSSRSFRGKTVLMMTHDFAPVLDMLYHHRSIFEIPNAQFLENINGILSEKAIEKDDIKTFLKITKENIESLPNNINKCVYLRRLYEITDDKGIPYHILSNLFHKRDKPIFTDGTTIDKNSLRSGIRKIKKWIPNFSYKELLVIVNDIDQMRTIYFETNSNYEKLQLYRIMFDEERRCQTSILKYINETFHIENDLIYQLNPCKYQMVPQYIIDVCNNNILT